MIQLNILEVVLVIFHSTTCQKESHRVYLLQNAYLQSTLTTPLKNCCGLSVILKFSPKLMLWSREFRPTFENVQGAFKWYRIPQFWRFEANVFDFGQKTPI